MRRTLFSLLLRERKLLGWEAFCVHFAATGRELARETGIHRLATASVGRTTFDRYELAAILDLYGRKVALGVWRDYAIDLLRDKAVFSVYRKASEYALYRIEKDVRLARKQGAYSVIAAGGLIMKRGHDLQPVLSVLENRLDLVSL